MAQRRMFSPQIVKSEEFLSMPTSSQALYFHLGMDADDDGFIQPKTNMKLLGSTDDDLKILLAKRFLLLFESGVLVIKHWLIHNLIQKDRYHPTRFQEEKKRLFIKENRAYTDNPDSVNKMLPEVRLGKDRLLGESKDSQEPYIIKEGEEDKPLKVSKAKYHHSKEIFGLFKNPQKSWQIDTTQLKHAELLYERGIGQVKGALKFVADYRGEEFMPSVLKPSDLDRKWLDLLEFKKKHGY